MSSRADNRRAGGVRKEVSTYCYQCINGPDLLTVEVVDGIATEIRPNFGVRGLHPADGKICVKPFGLVQKLYNPHRILKPLKRTNPRKGRDEDPGWVEIGWAEALDAVAAKLAPLRGNFTDAEGHPRLAFTTGGAGTPKHYMGAFPALFAAWGGPIDQSIGSGSTVACYHSEHLYGELWHRAFTVLPDTPRCNYIVAFGNNINASGGVPSVRRQADARARGMRRIQIEPHLSVTGATSHEWIPIRPKTDAAFLFAMLHVLLHEHRPEELDGAFLRLRTAAPYLVAPNGYYLRDPSSFKPLLWDEGTRKAVAFDTPGAQPALAGSFVASGAERGADGEVWQHESVTVRTAHQALVEHVASCTPEWAAAICDVPAETIRRIANEFLAEARVGETTEVGGRTLPCRPVAILLGKAVNNGWGGYECVWAQTMLQVLVGALEVPGGLVGSVSRIVGPGHDRMASCTPGEDGFMPYPFLPTDKASWAQRPENRHGHTTLTPLAGTGPLSQWLGSSTLAWLRLQGRAAPSWPRAKPPDVWIVYRCNPLISNSDTGKLTETVAQFPFHVSFAYTHDETSHFADIILPDCTDLESTQLLRIGGTESFEQIWETEGWALRQPAVAPRGEARDFDWIATELAKRIGLLPELNAAINGGACGIPLKTAEYDFSLDVAKEHTSDEIWDAACRAASHDLTRGEASDGLAYYREHGFRLRPFPRLNWYLYPRIEDLGLRFELPYQERVLRVGRQLANRLHENGIAWWDRQLEEYEPLPHHKDLNKYWDEALERNFDVKAKDFPFWVLTSRSMQYSWGGNVSLQLIKEVGDNVIGHDGIQLNAGRAAELGIANGDRIEVYSPIGAVTGKAILRQGIRPDVILITGQFGHWKTPFARDFDMPSANSLVPMHVDFLDGSGGTVDATKANVRRAGAARR
jgi:phenylacetyl-CoA:acceptor oxidoreductase